MSGISLLAVGSLSDRPKIRLLTVGSQSDRPAFRLRGPSSSHPGTNNSNDALGDVFNTAGQANETPIQSPVLTPTKRDFLEDLAAAESKDEEKAKEKANPKAKRAPSGWLLFCAEMRQVSAYSSPRAGKKLCERWLEMDSEQRAVWNDKAALIKDAMKRGETIPPFAQKWRS
jgi:hypothetical protein